VCDDMVRGWVGGHPTPQPLKFKGRAAAPVAIMVSGVVVAFFEYWLAVAAKIAGAARFVLRGAAQDQQ